MMGFEGIKESIHEQNNRKVKAFWRQEMSLNVVKSLQEGGEANKVEIKAVVQVLPWWSSG